MRKETATICRAFIQGVPKKGKRTATDGKCLTLHGNTIAWWNADGSISMTLAGWPTVTTRERLNGLCDMLGMGRPWHQSKHVQFFNGEFIASEAVITWHSILDLAA